MATNEEHYNEHEFRKQLLDQLTTLNVTFVELVNALKYGNQIERAKANRVRA